MESKTILNYDLDNLKKPSNKNLNCPIRGELQILEKAKDGFTFTEEYQRIECIKFLLKKKYPSENFDFETNILKYGNQGRNSLRADIVIYDRPKYEITGNKVEHIVLVAEIKRDGESKESGINDQLKPAINHCPNLEYGIYWDSENRILIKKDDLKENNILKLPIYGAKWEDKLINYEDLEPIESSKNILKVLEQKIHNLGGTNKDFRYREIFKVILTKYYDETKNKKKDYTEFQVLGKEEDNKKYLSKRINILYKEAKNYYSNNSPINLENELKLDDEILFGVIKVIETFSFNKTNQLLLQDFFMYFAPTFLKKDLDQYYTPQQIVNFMSSIVKISDVDCAIDSAGGSADFLTGLIKKGLSLGLENIKNNIYYWDISPDAGNVASLNMILNGDGRTNISIFDSLENYDEKNNFFQICLTNPPFGKNTIWSKDLNIMENYDLGHKWITEDTEISKTEEKFRQQLGILFIERNLKLLKEGGILEIIIPNGYLTNPSLNYIRKYLFDNYRVVASILLPEDVFKKSNASGFPVILIVKKEKVKGDYKIFTAVANKIGFDHKAKKIPPLFLRDKKTGDFLLDSENQKIPDDDLLLIEKQFKKFVCDNNIEGFESEDNNLNYSFTTKNTILNDKNLILCAKRSNIKYLNLLKQIKKEDYVTLLDLNADVSNSLSFSKNKEKQYIYLDTRELFTGYYKKRNYLMGWELPNRAKQSLNKYDILIAKTRGCFDKFCIILEDRDDLVATNGFWRIRIENEKQRLNFYHYLHTKEYKEQMEALATGTILADVKEDDLKEKLLIPTNNLENNYQKMKKFIEVQEELIKDDEDVNNYQSEEQSILAVAEKPEKYKKQ
jgi:type I restriction enzyme M protein